MGNKHHELIIFYVFSLFCNSQIIYTKVVIESQVGKGHTFLDGIRKPVFISEEVVPVSVPRPPVPPPPHFPGFPTLMGLPEVVEDNLQVGYVL